MEGIIRNRHVKLSEPISKKTLEQIKKALNNTLSGITAEQINLPLIVRFEEELGEHRSLAPMILRVLYEMLGSFDSQKMHIDGVTKLLSYPEFFNISKAQRVLALLEERQRFSKMLKNALPGQTSIFIGDDEQSELALPDTGFVFHPITIGKKVIGAIGVIGPKRMDYKKVIASLNYFVSGITESLNDGFDNIDKNNNDITGEKDYGRQEDKKPEEKH
jgi:heat-inducible transcriptional repressor